MATRVVEVAQRRWRSGDGSIVIGIGGGSGSGKSTIAAALVDGLQPLTVELIHLDRFFKRPEAMPTYFSTVHGERRPDFNHPNSVERADMIDTCRAAVSADPPSVVIIDGILALHYEELRSLMHLRCYVTIELNEMLAPRTQRNLDAGYGGTAEEIAFYNRECVSPQHQRFNAPTARLADVLIPNDTDATQDRDRIVAEICDSVGRLQAWRG